MIETKSAAPREEFDFGFDIDRRNTVILYQPSEMIFALSVKLKPLSFNLGKILDRHKWNHIEIFEDV